ncbi:MAG: UDP-N-acetylmuramoyl-tripeptide--D-alanyl-D-alanine ligase [Bacilli bacterium]|nr:UDP-N-acetylmuramoyl-tripeptide--D-alanyl-D-alanine ligase [Bacilli bacterium]
MLVREIIEATNGQLLKGNFEAEVKNITQDTRNVSKGDMYAALIGARDGHDFISQVEDIAVAVLVSKPVDTTIDNVILVEDTLKALGDIARFIREHSNVKVVGVTGSVGKTSTKDMIYSVVSTKYKTLKTLGNYNNHLGLPLTIFRYNDENVMILEMGMNHLGEISYLTNIAKPDIAVITNVGTAHIGELGSRENILKAKMEIVEGLNDNGTLIINGDNDMLSTVKEEGYVLKKVGIDCDSSLKVKDVILNETYSTFTLCLDKDYDVYVPIAGTHFVLNALVAIQVGLSLDISIEDCIKGVKSFTLTKNRNDIIELKDHIQLIDGTYNANLDSMKASIDVLSGYSGRKIAVLADMLELGEYEEKLHREVGKHLNDKNIDLLVTVGKASNYMNDEFNGISYHFDNNEEVKDFLIKEVKENDVLLLKGSNSMKLKEVVEYLKENLK